MFDVIGLARALGFDQDIAKPSSRIVLQESCSPNQRNEIVCVESHWLGFSPASATQKVSGGAGSKSRSNHFRGVVLPCSYGNFRVLMHANTNPKRKRGTQERIHYWNSLEVSSNDGVP